MADSPRNRSSQSCNGSAAVAAASSASHQPPLIGKAGRYTVFIKPPPLNATPGTPSPSKSTPTSFHTLRNISASTPTRKNAADLEAQKSPPSTPTKPTEASSANSIIAKISNAIAKIQSIHSAVDEYLADWFGLNQSKYQWYVDEYLEMKKMEAERGKPFETLGKGIEMPMIREQIMKR